MRLFGRRDGGETLDYSGPDEVEVKGESAYQADFEAIAGPKRDGGHDYAVTVTLRREPTNPYDPNAVACYVEDKLLGYVNRDDSAGMSLYLSRVEAANPGATVTAYGRIMGGWVRRTSEGNYGLRLFVDRDALQGL